MRSEPRNGEVWIDSRSQETTIDELRGRIKVGGIVATEYISPDGVVEAPGAGEPRSKVRSALCRSDFVRPTTVAPRRESK
jgi:hypothetical protein